MAAYSQSGPASRSVPQEILCRWEKCAQEGSYITNHTADIFTRASEIQEMMVDHFFFLQEPVVKGKAPKEVVDTMKELKDLSAFHTSMLVALWMVLL